MRERQLESRRLERYSDLSLPKQLLVRIFNRLWYGRVENLAIVDGQPAFGRGFRTFRTVKFTGRPASPVDIGGDFVLKADIVRMFEEFARTPNTVIEEIHVREGLPVIGSFEEPFQVDAP